MIDDIRAIAREHGYCVAEHGSMRRESDIDLLAAPWVKDAHAPKPYGRLGFVWLITLRHGSCPYYVDLSVMPRW